MISLIVTLGIAGTCLGQMGPPPGPPPGRGAGAMGMSTGTSMMGGAGMGAGGVPHHLMGEPGENPFALDGMCWSLEKQLRATMAPNSSPKEMMADKVHAAIVNYLNGGGEIPSNGGGNVACTIRNAKKGAGKKPISNTDLATAVSEKVAESGCRIPCFDATTGMWAQPPPGMAPPSPTPALNVAPPLPLPNLYDPLVGPYNPGMGGRRGVDPMTGGPGFSDPGMGQGGMRGMGPYDPAMQGPGMGNGPYDPAMNGPGPYDPMAPGMSNPTMGGPAQYDPTMGAQGQFDPTTGRQSNFDPSMGRQSNFDPSMGGQTNFDPTGSRSVNAQTMDRGGMGRQMIGRPGMGNTNRFDQGMGRSVQRETGMGMSRFNEFNRGNSGFSQRGVGTGRFDRVTEQRSRSLGTRELGFRDTSLTSQRSMRRDARDFGQRDTFMSNRDFGKRDSSSSNFGMSRSFDRGMERSRFADRYPRNGRMARDQFPRETGTFSSQSSGADQMGMAQSRMGQSNSQRMADQRQTGSPSSGFEQSAPGMGMESRNSGMMSNRDQFRPSFSSGFSRDSSPQQSRMGQRGPNSPSMVDPVFAVDVGSSNMGTDPVHNRNMGSQRGFGPQNDVGHQNGMGQQNGMGSQSRMNSQTGFGSQDVFDPQGSLNSQNGLDIQNGMGSQTGVGSQNGMNSQTGMGSQNGVNSQTGMSSQNGMNTQAGMSSQNGMGSQNKAASQNAGSSIKNLDQQPQTGDPAGSLGVVGNSLPPESTGSSTSQPAIDTSTPVTRTVPQTDTSQVFSQGSTGGGGSASEMAFPTSDMSQSTNMISQNNNIMSQSGSMMSQSNNRMSQSPDMMSQTGSMMSQPNDMIPHSRSGMQNDMMQSAQGGLTNDIVTSSRGGMSQDMMLRQQFPRETGGHMSSRNSGVFGETSQMFTGMTPRSWRMRNQESTGSFMGNQLSGMRNRMQFPRERQQFFGQTSQFRSRQRFASSAATSPEQTFSKRPPINSVNDRPGNFNFGDPGVSKQNHNTVGDISMQNNRNEINHLGTNAIGQNSIQGVSQIDSQRTHSGGRSNTQNSVGRAGSAVDVAQQAAGGSFAGEHMGQRLQNQRTRLQDPLMPNPGPQVMTMTTMGPDPYMGQTDPMPAGGMGPASALDPLHSGIMDMAAAVDPFHGIGMRPVDPLSMMGIGGAADPLNMYIGSPVDPPHGMGPPIDPPPGPRFGMGPPLDPPPGSGMGVGPPTDMSQSTGMGSAMDTVQGAGLGMGSAMGPSQRGGNAMGTSFDPSPTGAGGMGGPMDIGPPPVNPMDPMFFI